MAVVEFSGIDEIDATFRKLERFETRRVVMAGADAAIEVLKGATESPKRHIVSGAMKDSISPGQYKETVGGGSIEVYPQGTDSRGVLNMMKAKLIERGQGRKPKPDKFLTGPATKSKLEAAVDKAFRTEVDKIFREAGG